MIRGFAQHNRAGEFLDYTIYHNYNSKIFIGEN